MPPLFCLSLRVPFHPPPCTCIILPSLLIPPTANPPPPLSCFRTPPPLSPSPLSPRFRSLSCLSPGNLDPVGDAGALLGGRQRNNEAHPRVVHLAVVVDNRTLQPLRANKKTSKTYRRYHNCARKKSGRKKSGRKKISAPIRSEQKTKKTTKRRKRRRTGHCAAGNKTKQSRAEQGRYAWRQMQLISSACSRSFVAPALRPFSSTAVRRSFVRRFSQSTIPAIEPLRK